LQVEDMQHLRGVLAEVKADREARVLVISASGPSFCAGFDLSALPPGSSRDEEAYPEVHLKRLCDEVEAFPLPTVCAINGGVYGGGTDLALACDFRIGVRATRVRMPAVQLGISFYPTGIERYVTRLGLAASKRLFLLGEEFEAGELASIGFLDAQVEDHAALESTVRDFVDRLTAMPPLALSNTKHALNAAARSQLDADQSQREFLRSLSSDEFAAAHAAWSQRKSRAKVDQ